MKLFSNHLRLPELEVEHEGQEFLIYVDADVTPEEIVGRGIGVSVRVFEVFHEDGRPVSEAFYSEHEDEIVDEIVEYEKDRARAGW